MFLAVPECLKIIERIQFGILPFTYEFLQINQPFYLRNLLTTHPASSNYSRSSSLATCLCTPSAGQLHLKYRSVIRNSLPKEFRQPASTTFVSRLALSSSWRLSSAWSSGLGHVPSCFTAHEFDESRVQTPGADTVNQAVHPSGVGKLVAISMQRVVAVEDCEGKSVRLYDGWRVDYAAGWRKPPHVDFLQFALAP
jgi:hypothetical protein